MKTVLLQLTGSGGTQLYISQLATNLSKNNCETTVVLGSYLFDENQYDNSDAKIILVDAQASYTKMLFKLVNPYTYYSIIKLINKEKPDIVHLVLEDLISGIVLLILKIKGQKLVLTEHDPSHHIGEKLIESIHVQFTKFLVRSVADKIIVHGESLKNILVQKGVPKNKINVIPHGDYSYYNKWAKTTFEEPKSILFFGRILEYKGLEYLIKSAPKVISSVPNAKFVIAGSGDFKKYETMIEDRQFFEIHNRFILDEEIATFFQKASVVVLPYIDASQSGIIPISYAFKKPVIVTNVGSISEVVDDGITGFVIPPKNIEALADSIIKILNDDSMRMKMGENSYKKMIDELSWGKASELTINAYEDIIKGLP